MSKNSFGSKHATCLGCPGLFANEDLSGGYCLPCQVRRRDRKEMILAKAERQTEIKLAREVLNAIRVQSKGEATSPKILEASMRRLGGADRLGEILAEQLLKATGEELTPQEMESWHYSPQAVHRFSELLVRLAVKNDEREKLDIGSMSDQELMQTLAAFSLELLETSAEYREMMVREAIQRQPDLINVAMTAAGMPVVDAPAPATPVTPIAVSDTDEGAEVADEDDWSAEAIDD